MSEYGKDKGMSVDCKAMETEGGARGRGVRRRRCSRVESTGAEAVTWSKRADSERSASPYIAYSYLPNTLSCS